MISLSFLTCVLTLCTISVRPTLVYIVCGLEGDLKGECVIFFLELKQKMKASTCKISGTSPEFFIYPTQCQFRIRKNKTGQLLHAQYPTALIRSRRIKLGVIMEWWKEKILVLESEKLHVSNYVPLQFFLIIFSLLVSLYYRIVTFIFPFLAWSSLLGNTLIGFWLNGYT